METFLMVITIMGLFILAIYWSIQIKELGWTALFAVLAIMSFVTIGSVELKSSSNSSQELIASTKKICTREYKDEFNRVYKTEFVVCD